MTGVQTCALPIWIGLGGATVAQIGRALEGYEMLTKQELALWTIELKGSEELMASAGKGT